MKNKFSLLVIYSEKNKLDAPITNKGGEKIK